MVTASTHVSSADSVGTADLLRFRAPAAVCTSSLCRTATRTSMDSLPRSRRSQAIQAILKTTSTTYIHICYWLFQLSSPNQLLVQR